MTEPQTRWQKLFNSKEESLLDKEFHLLASRYAESHRFYHTLDHVISCLHPSQPVTADEKYLLDIDLSILGATPALYAEYETWIRKEYRYVPGFFYKKGRRKVLESFLAQPSIYLSADFKERNESAARTNLEKAILAL
ncbi:MAG: hypothetical protein KUG82_06905 [Pseudomonadales bacterium]|nr:hypothetical protein [Pseudomonadales bacterium]